MSDLEIRQIRFGAPAVQVLVAAAQADLVVRYGADDETPVEAVQFDPPEGAFLIARLAGEAVACGGWRTLSHFFDAGMPEDVAEIKRMYAVPAVRGGGVARELLLALEDSARQHGMRRMVLESATRSPEALKFYEKNGYARIANYGYYKDALECVSFGRDL